MLEPADLICSPSPFPAWEFKGTQSQTYAVLTTPSFATLKEGVTKKFAGEYLCKYSFGIC